MPFARPPLAKREEIERPAGCQRVAGVEMEVGDNAMGFHNC